MSAQSAGAVEYADCVSAEELDPTHRSPGYVIRLSDALGNVEYACIAITSRSTQTKSNSTC